MEGLDTSNILLYLFLLAALAVGWWLGRRSRSNNPLQVSRDKRKPGNDYFIGLNYLLNDEPDDAIDIFIDALEINSNTLQTHMALGTLLRRRGKVDRSIAVYQDLLGQTGFSHDEMNEIKLNLVQSYISGGLLDRAEQLLTELRNQKGAIRHNALVHSINVYQQEKDREEGIDALQELVKVCAPVKRGHYQNLASHFYCELAEAELEQGHTAKAREFLRKAVSLDKANSRVSMLLGQMEYQSGNYKEALKNYQRVQKQDESFLADVFAPMVECYLKADKEKNLQKFIDTCMQESRETTLLIKVAAYLEKEKGQEQARQFLVSKLREIPTLGLLAKAIGLSDNVGQQANEVSLYLQVLNDYVESRPQYQCTDCGFELKNLLWHCPSCLHWGSVKHISGEN